MTTENKPDEMANELSDEMLEGIAGGAIHQAASNQWQVIDDSTSEVVKTLSSKTAAIAYAKKNGYSTTII